MLVQGFVFPKPVHANQNGCSITQVQFAQSSNGSNGSKLLILYVEMDATGMSDQYKHTTDQENYTELPVNINVNFAGNSPMTVAYFTNGSTYVAYKEDFVYDNNNAGKVANFNFGVPANEANHMRYTCSKRIELPTEDQYNNLPTIPTGETPLSFFHHNTTPLVSEKFNVCSQIPDSVRNGSEKLKEACCRCQSGNDYCSPSSQTSTDSIWTALGCIKTDTASIVQAILQTGLSIAGGVALLMFLFAGFMISTAQGEAKRVTDAREMLTSAIIGIIFIVFSVAILQFIGVSVFHIPGFGG